MPQLFDHHRSPNRIPAKRRYALHLLRVQLVKHRDSTRSLPRRRTNHILHSSGTELIVHYSCFSFDMITQLQKGLQVKLTPASQVSRLRRSLHLHKSPHISYKDAFSPPNPSNKTQSITIHLYSKKQHIIHPSTLSIVPSIKPQLS